MRHEGHEAFGVPAVALAWRIREQPLELVESCRAQIDGERALASLLAGTGTAIVPQIAAGIAEARGAF
jgi:hypothetical protein